jgi:hypothetical protein
MNHSSFEAVPADLIDQNHLFMTVSTMFNNHARSTYLNPDANSEEGRNEYPGRRLLNDNSIGIFSDPNRYAEAAELCDNALAVEDALRVEQGYAPSTNESLEQSRTNCLYDYSHCNQDAPLSACSRFALSNTESVGVVDRGTPIFNMAKAQKWAAENGIVLDVDTEEESGAGVGIWVAVAAVGSVLVVGIAAFGLKSISKKKPSPTIGGVLLVNGQNV